HAADRIAVRVQKSLNAANDVDVGGAIVTPAAATLQRLHLREFRFPKAQHMLRHADLVGDFADRAEGVGALRAHCLPFAHEWPFIAALTRSLSTWLGRNTSTRRGSIGTSSPVFGLRPTRPPFWRTANEPNDDSFTLSPRMRLSAISSSTRSTSCADSVRL